MPEADSSPKKLEPCVGDLDGTHAFYLPREALGAGPGHDCYITSTSQSPVSFLTLHSSLSSAVKIAPMFFFWSGGFQGYPPLHIIFSFFCSRSKYLTCHLPSHLTTLKEFIRQWGHTQWDSALNLFTLICTIILNENKPGVSVFIWERKWKTHECGLTDAFVVGDCKRKKNLLAELVLNRKWSSICQRNMDLTYYCTCLNN